jgi:asparagine synthase (glutamine-hydrolysing)
MCGIVGAVSTGAPVAAEAAREAAARLAKRGPDDAGEWAEGPATLGHRRLSILDLSSTGHQPMVSADGRHVIVLNGEIYNFLDLRRELDPDERAWRSSSDTEVVLAAYARWGEDCLRRFHGMFAFAIWDRAEQRLFAARDRMGVKPFYYHAGPRGFLFASRPRALFALDPALSRALDEQAMRYYLEVGYIPAPWSIHKAVRKLPPAHCLTLDRSGLRVGRYWDFRHIAPEPAWRNRSEEDLLDELDEIVSRSVRLRMVADVPLGAFLSGGIDSTLVVAAMRKHSAQPIRSFTIGFNEPEYDESAHAARVARALGTEHQVERLGVDDLLGLVPTFHAEYDEPFFDSSAFPTLAVSRMARRHVTVSLSGDGGDELFGGYHYYRIMRGLAPLYAAPSPVRRLAAAAAGVLPGHSMKLLAAALREPDAGAAFAFARSIGKDFRGVLLPEVLARTRSLRQLFADARAAFPPVLTAAEEAMRLDATYTLPDDYLQKVDLATMAFSLEARDPLLDQDLVEWAMKLPLAWKLRRGDNKYLLRRLAYRYVPREILDRPKQGFGVPIDRWLRGPLQAWADERLGNPAVYANLPLDRSRVQQLFALHLSGARNVYPLLWAALVLLDFASEGAIA